MQRGIQAMMDYADAQEAARKAGKKTKKDGPANLNIVFDPAHSVGEMFDALQAKSKKEPKNERKKTRKDAGK
jgi:hypothetical protein